MDTQGVVIDWYKEYKKLEVALRDLIAASEGYWQVIDACDPEHDEGPTEEEVAAAEDRLLRGLDGARLTLRGEK